MPHVSIGLPVYNCEQYVGEAIESVLAQTFEDFELIISDNASTDRTDEICREYATKDSRVRYYRNEKNLGAAKNFNRVFELSSGEYFKWVAADEGIEPEFLEKAVEVLDNNPSVVIALTRYIQYHEVQKSVWLRSDDHNAMSPKVSQRFWRILTLMRSNVPIWGLIRSSKLRKTHLIRPFIGADGCLLVELGLMGKFYQIPEHLLRVRDHPGAYHYLKAKQGGREGAAEATWFDPENKGTVYLPYWRRLWEYFLVVIRSDAKWSDKLTMLVFLFKHFAQKYRWLGSELIHAVGLGLYYTNLKKTIKKCISF